MNEPFPPVLESRAVVLRLESVDTDIITPIARVLEGPEAVVRHAFEPLRVDEAGLARFDDPFADPDRAGAAILIAGRNFGCGSSRETAVQAVRGMGFRAVLAPSFGDIFYSNCLKNAVLAVRLPPDVVEIAMNAADDLIDVVIDLAAQTVRCECDVWPFDIGILQKQMLLAGTDEIGTLLARAGARAAFDARDAAFRPWVRDRADRLRPLNKDRT